MGTHYTPELKPTQWPRENKALHSVRGKMHRQREIGFIWVHGHIITIKSTKCHSRVNIHKCASVHPLHGAIYFWTC